MAKFRVTPGLRRIKKLYFRQCMRLLTEERKKEKKRRKKRKKSGAVSY